MNAARPQKKRLSPRSIEGGNVGGIGNHAWSPDRPPSPNARRECTELLSPRPNRARRCGHRGAETVAGIHQAEKYFRAGMIRNDVGRATALNGADVERACAERSRSLGMGMRRIVLKRIQQFLDGRLAQMRIGGVRHAALRDDLVTQRALRSERELVFRGLAVDQIAAAARVAGGGIGAGAIALLAHDEKQRDAADAIRSTSASAA